MKPVAEQPGGESVLLRRAVPRDKQALLAKRLRGLAQKPETGKPLIARHYATEGALSFGQQRFWFLEQLEPGKPVYHVCFTLSLTGPVSHVAIENALTEIVRRHESLRTVFARRDGAPIQTVLAPQHFTVPVINETADRLHDRMASEAGRPFNLARDLPLRVTIFRLAPDNHVLLFVMHHIATDAWSIRLLLDEFAALYDATAIAKPVNLPEVSIQYLDFAGWQRGSVEMASADLAYWKRQLAASPLLELPADHPRSAETSDRGATRSITLNRELSNSIGTLASQGGASKFMALLASFKVLLQRYSGQDDILAGCPVSRRMQQQTENLIGLFLNISVLRTDLSGDPSFRELLARVRHTALEAYAHQNIPFEKIVEELHPARDASRTPLFQVMFTYQDAPTPARTLAGSLHAEFAEFDLPVAPFDITLLVQDDSRGLVATIEYKTDLFSEATIDRMLGHFRSLLEGIVRNPDARISELPLLTAVERRQLLTEFNAAPVDLPRDKCVHELFEEQVDRAPAASAIKFGSHVLTYRELNERANQLAHHLKAAGVGVETPVGICLERSPDMVVALLAILKAGGAYVPFEADEPVERVDFKLRNAGVTVLVTREALLSHLPCNQKSSARVICLDRDHAAIARHSRVNVSTERPGPGNLVYIIYTSGSTGTPKGVMIEHRSLVNHSFGIARHFDLGPADRVLQFAPLSFDVSAEEIFPTLLTGGKLVLRPAGLSVSVQDFHPFVASEKLTVLNLPTPYWRQWIDVIEKEHLPLPPSLRLLITGSDTVHGDDLSRWQNIAAGRVRWCNAYGTTEATITATIYEPRPGQTPSPVPIGRPTMNTQIYILDRHRHLSPFGVPGEIFIGGEEVARGYVDRSDAENFVPDIFSRRPGARLNRTGDFGRWLPDGNIEFLGRRDNQVKIRGFRIELAEIESTLLQHPEVPEAVVVVRHDCHGEKSLAAYVTTSDAVLARLRDFLKQRLPSYMVPAAIVPLGELPRLPSGKVDVTALPDPGNARPELEEAFVAPSDSLEEKLAGIWRHVLGLEKVGVHDNFFDLGGHSLLAVRLFTEIEKLTGWNVPVLTLFQSPTIKQIAEIIRRTQCAEKRSSILQVQSQGARPPIFLVHGAGGGMLWGYANLAKYMGPDQPVYAFNSRGLDGMEEFSTIEALAANYVEELAAFQPNGPYHLGGYCFGGEVAFEMARLLEARGAAVGSLVLINSMPSGSSFYEFAFTPLWMARFVRNSWHWFRYFCRWSPRRRRAFLLRKTRVAWKRLQRCWNNSIPLEPSAEDTIDLSLYSEDQRRLWDAHLRASDNYRPRPYSGKLTLLRTGVHPFFCSFDPTYGWGELARGGVTVKIVPGDHESILAEPHVRAVAAQLSDCLARAQMPHEVAR